MRQLFNLWIAIAVLMEKPFDYPADRRSFQLAVIAAVASFVLASTMVIGFVPAVLLATLDMTLAAACLWAALSIVGKTARFSQAFGAYCGASTVLNLASIFMLNTPEPDAAASGLTLNLILHFVYLVWGISLVAHILRFTFEISLPASILAATGYLILTLAFVGLLFPQ